MATYTKLRSGEWGVKVQGTTEAGKNVVVTKKNGDTKNARILKVIWTNGKVSICAIARNNGRSNGYVPAKRDSRGYVTQRGHHEGYCGYDCPVTGLKCCPKNGPCHDCQ